MAKLNRVLFLLLIVATAAMAGFPIKAEETARPEVRALWVDAFRDGIKTPEQVDKLIADSVTGNINTLIVQVRRRGDAYYNQSLEPRTEDPDLKPGFDALQDLIEKAHAHHIEVHAWLNTLVAWNSSVPPKDPAHIWNAHGPNSPEKSNWISYFRTQNSDKTWSDKLTSSYYLDPGNPDAVDFTVNVYLNVVKNYDVDGIHLDYSRYADRGWGYNPTSVARYNVQFGTSGLPSPGDPRWCQWRREQTANLVRKLYLNAIAIKPNLKVSSAVISWGDGPISSDDWYQTRAYNQVYQDWRGWLEEGIIDMVMPMNYFSEWSGTQQTWYNRWIEWEKDHQYGRQIVIGPGIQMQYIEHSIDQIRRAQAPSTQGNYAAGVCLFAYGASNLYSCNDFKDAAFNKAFPRQPHAYLPATNGWLYILLAKEGSYTDPVTKNVISTQPVFAQKVPVPDMPWKSKPTMGYLMGNVSDSSGKNYDHIKINVDSCSSDTANADGIPLHREVYTDGHGWYGLAQLPPGLYQIFPDKQAVPEAKTRLVFVKEGRVMEADFQIGSAAN